MKMVSDGPAIFVLVAPHGSAWPNDLRKKNGKENCDGIEHFSSNVNFKAISHGGKLHVILFLFSFESLPHVSIIKILI